MQITTLKLALYQDNGVQVGLPKVAIFHWKDKTWTEIQDPIQGTNVIQNASPYINNGIVHVRLSTESNNFACTYLDMGLEAEPASGQGGTK
ncbi:MAG: hypothetical protein IH586_00120 [Anaerolineaceae bacterium]|nr:hypothetical protein [Anaerolineaceae bacterium]